MKPNFKQTLLLFVLLGAFYSGKAQFYTGMHHEFGKNRVQYNSQFWQTYNFERFKVHFVTGGKNLAIYSARSANKSLAVLENYLDVHLDEKLEIVVFNTHAKFKQTNIGLVTGADNNIGGVTKLVGNKLFVYYEGNHAQLDQQIKAGLAEICIYHILLGSNWRELLRNQNLHSLPDWYQKGLISYLSREWDTKLDDRVRDGILNNKYKNFNRIEGEEAEIVGHAMWNFIAEVYGANTIPNMIYMTKVSRNLESGFNYILNTNLAALTRDFNSFYSRRYSVLSSISMPAQLEKTPIKSRKNRDYYGFETSPNGRYLTYVSNELGKYKLFLYDTEKKKSKKITQADHKMHRKPDRSSPVIAWHPAGEAFAYVEEKKGKLLMTIYNIESGQRSVRTLMRMEKVYDMAYSPDGKNMVFSGYEGGRTDLFLYKIVGNSHSRITDDYFDDINPKFISNEKIIFSSNRNNDSILPLEKIPSAGYDRYYDVYILDLNSKSRMLERITNTPYINEVQPQVYPGGKYTYLSDESGIYNRYLAYRDSTMAYIDTSIHYRYFTVTSPLSNMPVNILEMDVSPRTGKMALLLRQNGKYYFYTTSSGMDKLLTSDELPKTDYRRYITAMVARKTKDAATPKDKPSENQPNIRKENKIDTENYQFEDEKPTFEKEKITLSPSKSNATLAAIGKGKNKVELPEFELPRQEVYNINFTSDYVISQLDNQYLSQMYQRFSPEGLYQNPGFNSMFKIGLSDLFEDYRIVGAMRLPINFNTSEYMISFENLKNRWDKRYTGMRQSFFFPEGNNFKRIQSYTLNYRLSYPFSEITSLRITSTLRGDRIHTLSADNNSLRKPSDNRGLGGVKLEYVYDNTLPVGLNLFNGLRFKLWIEGYHELNRLNTDFFVAGADFRHYLKIHRNIIWANRFATSASFGTQKLLYFMGGVDNWMFARFDPSIQIDPNQNYQFLTIATPLRGFIQNARNGSNFAVINSELRVPLFRYFSAQPIKSAFLNNFQVIGFGDVGTAWTGLDPYSQENSFNTTIIWDKPLLITLQNQREPIIYGYGFGLRSRIFGYFARFDLAWGVDDGVRLKPVRYFSLTFDF
ncbi:MAG: hypothetical protein ACK4K0_06250 [Flavobacteriales bacterium]